MRSSICLLFLFLFVCWRGTAQIVGGSVFLQGNFLEIGETGTGAFGACNPPAGYHPHLFGGGTTALAEVYDYGHDGWTVGSPPYMGDYTEPGVQSEGWSVQVGPTEYRNWVYGSPCFGTTTVPGSITGYSNTGGMFLGTWTGAVVGLNIVAQTRVDANASAVVVTVQFTNTTTSPLGPVYYERMCDPDNTSTWSTPTFGSSLTHNFIEHQNENATHKVVVSATGVMGGSYAPFTYMALGTKDCRAKAFYQTSGLAPTTTPAAIYSGATGYISGLYDSSTNDVAIDLVYSLGTLAAAGSPGDKTIISYAYFFNGATGIDSAFPDPQLVINGVPQTRSAPPVADYDTLNACDYPGTTVFPVDLRYADDKNWSWSTWTWSPAVGLASTTGVHNTIDVTVLPGTTTYTITGSDSATGMLSCNRKTFYLTIKTCHDATANSPCEGDSLLLNMNHGMPGDSYVWWGPLPSTTIFSSVVNPIKFPATMADAGIYYVVRTRAGVHDTDSVTVVIHPRPVLTATSNIPLCAPAATDLDLSVSPFLPGGTYSWTGPLGYSSILQNPVITPFVLADTGTYIVIGISADGCKDTATTYVYPGTTAAFTFEINRGCDADTVMVTNTSTNGLNYTWNFGDGSAPVSASGVPSSLWHEYPVHKIYSVSITSQNQHCTDTHTEVVDTRHTATAEFQANNDTICVNAEPTNLVDLSTVLVGIPAGTLSSGVITSWDWDFGDGSAHETIAGPAHTYTAPGIYPVTLTITDSIGCPYTVQHPVVAIDPVLHGLSDTLVCLVQPMPINISVEMRPNIPFTNYTYEWAPATGLSSSTVQSPFFTGFGDYTYTVTAIAQPYTACPMKHVVNVHSVEGAKLMNVTGNSTIKYGDHIQLYSSNEIKYMWKPNDGSLNNNNINNPVATPTVTTVYTVYGMDKYGCLDSAFITVVVDSTMSEFVPTGFTPNGDGLNDIFRPTYLKYQKLVEFSIYNRWGQRIFSTSNKEDGWDGTYNKTPQDMGVYYYNIIISRAGYSTNQIYKGEVTLIR